MSNTKTKQLASRQYALDFWATLDKSIVIQESRGSKDVALYPSEARACVPSKNGSGKVAIGNCIRASWFRNKAQRVLRDKDYKPDFDITVPDYDAQSLWKFKISSYTELALHDEAKRAEIYNDNSVKFEWVLDMEDAAELPIIRGEVDLTVMQVPDSDVLIGGEVKSISGYYTTSTVFGKYSKKGYWLEPPQPLEKNLLQTILYSHYWCVKNQDYKYFKLLYISREDGKRSEHDIDLVEEEVAGEVKHRVYVDQKPYKHKLYSEDILDSYRELHRYVLDNKVPPRDYELQYSDAYIAELAKQGALSKTDMELYSKGKKVTKGDSSCAWCIFKTLCYDASNGNTPILYDSEPFNHPEIFDNLPTLEELFDD